MILFVALPSHGGVPGGGGSQWEAAAGGDSPCPGGGHAEWPTPPGPGELPGCTAGRPPQGEHHTRAHESIFYPLFTSLHLSVAFCPLSRCANTLTHTSVRPRSASHYLWPVANLISCQKTLCQLAIHHEENGLLQPEQHALIHSHIHTKIREHKVNHIWTLSYNPCVVFSFFIPFI